MPCYDPRDRQQAEECPRRAAVVRALLCNALKHDQHPTLSEMASRWMVYHTEIDRLAAAPEFRSNLERVRDEFRRFELMAYEYLVQHRLLERS